MEQHEVELWTFDKDGENGRLLGTITVFGTQDAEAIQLAATAAESLKSAEFRVGGESFTQEDITEWWA